MSKEKQIEIIIDLLIEFDEMGFVPIVPCPDPEAYAIEWKEKLIKALQEYRKQSEIVRCKDCEHFYQDGTFKVCRHWNCHSTEDDAYCSYAKMKGGAI